MGPQILDTGSLWFVTFCYAVTNDNNGFETEGKKYKKNVNIRKICNYTFWIRGLGWRSG
jgi:hypothetical protein